MVRNSWLSFIGACHCFLLLLWPHLFQSVEPLPSSLSLECRQLLDCEGMWIGFKTGQWKSIAQPFQPRKIHQANNSSPLFDLTNYKWIVFVGDSNTRMLHNALAMMLCKTNNVYCALLFPYSHAVIKPENFFGIPNSFRSNYKNKIKEELGIQNEDHDVLIKSKLGSLRLSFRMFTGDSSHISKAITNFHKLFCFGISTTDRKMGKCLDGKEVETEKVTESFDTNQRTKPKHIHLPDKWDKTSAPNAIFASDTLWKLFGNRMFDLDQIGLYFKGLKHFIDTQAATVNVASLVDTNRSSHEGGGINTLRAIRLFWLPFYDIRWEIIQEANRVKFLDFTNNGSVSPSEYISLIPRANAIRTKLASKYGFHVINVTNIATALDLAYDRLENNSRKKRFGYKSILSADGIHQSWFFYEEVARHILNIDKYCLLNLK